MASGYSLLQPQSQRSWARVREFLAARFDDSWAGSVNNSIVCGRHLEVRPATSDRRFGQVEISVSRAELLTNMTRLEPKYVGVVCVRCATCVFTFR